MYRKPQSPGDRVFNIYELAELILENLNLTGLVKAQQICKTAQKVILDSQRIRQTLLAYEDELRHLLQPFTEYLDFDATLNGSRDDGPYLYARHCCPNMIGSGIQKTLHLPYRVGFGQKPERHCDNRALYDMPPIPHDRTVFIPRQAECSTAPVSKSKDTLPELWRFVAWSQSVNEVQVTVLAKCSKGHEIEHERKFPGSVTLGEVYDWMRKVAGDSPRQHDPNYRCSYMGTSTSYLDRG